MNGLGLLGLLAILYAIFVVFVAIKKPPKIWGMQKIKIFRKVLGEKGTVIFFYVWAVLFTALGVWLLMK